MALVVIPFSASVYHKHSERWKISEVKSFPKTAKFAKIEAYAEKVEAALTQPGQPYGFVFVRRTPKELIVCSQVEVELNAQGLGPDGMPVRTTRVARPATRSRRKSRKARHAAAARATRRTVRGRRAIAVMPAVTSTLIVVA